MKIALVHDYIKEYGGAERVLEELHSIFPTAPVYTTVFVPGFLGPHQARFSKMEIHTSWLQYVPYKEKFISIFRIIAPFVFCRFDLSGYDVIIVSQTGAYFPNFVKKGKSRLITYTHTPPRYLYGYKTARDWKKHTMVRIFGEFINHFLRIADFVASRNVDQFVANSKEVQNRIRKFYRRDARVIYPPVRIPIHKTPHSTRKSDSYYLAGGRLARAKGMDVIVDAFCLSGRPLKIFGKGFAGYEQELKIRIQDRGVNIEFVGEVSDEQKFMLMENAKAYIFASYDEDFGITPVEAMSVGTPVIAYRSGGVQETVVDDVTGIFYTPNTQEALNKAIDKFEKKHINPAACISQSRKFSQKIFDKEITEVVASVVSSAN